MNSVLLDPLGGDSDVYKKNSSLYELFSQAEDTPNKVSSYLSWLVKNKVVLDIGCGTWKMIPNIAPHTEKYIWIDISASQLALAAAKSKWLQNVELICSSASSIPLPDKSVDVVLATWVIWSIHNLHLRSSILMEMYRVLKDDGVIYIVENGVWWEYRDILNDPCLIKKTQEKISRLYNAWFEPLVQLESYFDFKTIDAAKKVFSELRSSEVASKIKSAKIQHNIIIYRNNKHSILSTTSYVVRNAKHVEVNKDQIKALAKDFQSSEGSYSRIDESPFAIKSLNNEQKLMLMWIFNTISFSYRENPYRQVTYKWKTYTRWSWSLLASIFRAIDEWYDILNPMFLSCLKKEELTIILRWNIEISLLEERTLFLNQLWDILIGMFNWNFSDVIRLGNQDANQILDILIHSFPFFKDTREYKGKEIFFYKRAQALVESIYSISGWKWKSSLKNIECLTALADYVLPNVLRNLWVLKYSEELTKIIDNSTPIIAWSEEEIEIRAATIQAVYQIKQEILSRWIMVNSLEINDYLWLKWWDILTPFHKTRTTAY
jgi:ubiquinone/menaquinone biosynthesis C-methylase UbiE